MTRGFTGSLQASRSLSGDLAELVGAGAPAFVEAHLLVRVAVGVVAVQRDGAVERLAVARIVERDDRGEREAPQPSPISAGR